MSGVIHFLKSLYESFKRNRCSLQAAGLTYFSLLAVVPIMCLLLLFAKTMGAGDFARDRINAYLDDSIAQIENGQENLPSFLMVGASEEVREAKRMAARDFAKQARTVSNEIFDRIDNFDVSTLGWIGLGFLLWTVISTLGIVEDSFNDICGATSARPIWKRCVLYVSATIILPLLIAAALSMPIMHVAIHAIDVTMGLTSVTKVVGDFLIAFLTSGFVGFVFTYAFSSLTFAFLFYCLPNIRIGFRSALEGGVITAFAFGGWVKVCAIAQVGIAKSNALYGSFAFVPILLAWLYMSWQIILLGCTISYAFHSVHSRRCDGIGD